MIIGFLSLTQLHYCVYISVVVSCYLLSKNSHCCFPLSFPYLFYLFKLYVHDQINTKEQNENKNKEFVMLLISLSPLIEQKPHQLHFVNIFVLLIKSKQLHFSSLPLAIS